MRYAVLLAWLLLLVVGVWLLRVTTTEVQPGFGDEVEADGLNVAPLAPVAGAVVSGGGGGERVVGKPSRWQDQILGTNEVGEPILPDYWFADISQKALAKQRVVDPAGEWNDLNDLLAQVTNDVVNGEITLTNRDGTVTTMQGNGLSRQMLIEAYLKTRTSQQRMLDPGWMRENVPPGYHGHPATGVVMKGEHDDATCPVR